MYKVGYPQIEGRIGDLPSTTSPRCRHELTADEIDKLATITPYATGASIKDIVNEALVIAIRDERETIELGRRRQGEAAEGARPARTITSTSSASGTRWPCTRHATRSWPTGSAST